MPIEGRVVVNDGVRLENPTAAGPPLNRDQFEKPVDRIKTPYPPAKDALGPHTHTLGRSGGTAPGNAGAIQKRYDADLKAWREHALEVGGIKDTATNAVLSPAGMSLLEFRKLTGPVPRFIDYEKGGPKASGR